MKKFALLVAAGALATAPFALPSPATASCHEIVEGQCIENVICNAVHKVPGTGNLNCIE